MNKTTLETLLFACRWLLVPFYVALVIALLALLGKVVQHAYELATHFGGSSEEDIILSVLGIVDLTLTGSLVVLIIFSSYSNFVSRIDLEDHPNWPRWMAAIDFSELKLKLLASVVAISGIKLLEAYMNIDHQTDRQLGWQAGLYGVFVMAAFVLALADWFGHKTGADLDNGGH